MLLLDDKHVAIEWCVDRVGKSGLLLGLSGPCVYQSGLSAGDAGPIRYGSELLVGDAGPISENTVLLTGCKGRRKLSVSGVWTAFGESRFTCHSCNLLLPHFSGFSDPL